VNYPPGLTSLCSLDRGATCRFTASVSSLTNCTLQRVLQRPPSLNHPNQRSMGGDGAAGWAPAVTLLGSLWNQSTQTTRASGLSSLLRRQRGPPHCVTERRGAIAPYQLAGHSRPPSRGGGSSVGISPFGE